MDKVINMNEFIGAAAVIGSTCWENFSTSP